MEKIILIKYGELSTKKANKNFFIKTLQNNIKNVLGSDTVIKYDFGRMYIYPNDDFDTVLDNLKNVFGVHEVDIAYRFMERNIDSINKNILNLLEDRAFNTFKVEVKRSDKSYEIDSMSLRKMIGGFLLKNIDDIKVDIHNPDLLINVEIRLDDILVYMDSLKGSGGYPVGTLGKSILMLSGGIDSPVAGYLAMKRGIKLEAIYFESPPHTSDEAREKVIKLAKKLAIYNNDIKLHIVNFTEIQEAIYTNIDKDYLITIMRRMMYRISAIVGANSNCHAIINGESIGQVASQTLTSMKAINEVVKIPVIRPLACFDKLEIIDIANKINTYDISILPYEDCCTIFVPTHPVINPSLEKCVEFEKLIDYENMIYNAVKNKKTITITKEEEKIYEDLL